MREFTDDNVRSSEPASPVDRIRAFLVDGPDRVEAVLQAVRERDFQKVEQGALELRAESGRLGVLGLQATCDQLRAASRQPRGLCDAVRRLRHDFEEAFGALGHLLESYD